MATSAHARESVSGASDYGYMELTSLFAGAGPAMAVATVYRCVKLLSDSVAQLPLRYMRRRGGIFVPDTDSPLHGLLTVAPNDALSAYDFKAQAVIEMLMDGNAYIHIERRGLLDEPCALTLCRRGTVSYDRNSGWYSASDTESGVVGLISPDDMIHLKWITVDDPHIGLSVLSYARTVIDTASTGDAATKSSFANGGNVRGILSNDNSVRGYGEYQDAELDRAALDIDSKFRRGQRIVPTPGDAKFTPISLSSADMQFLEARRFAVRDICRFFGVHPSYVFDDTSNNYKSAEMANVAFLSSTLNPILCKIENELLRKLVTPSLRQKRRIQFDRNELMMCDLTSRADYQAKTIGTGLYTVNEWRAAENKPPVEGGDKVLVSANLKGIDELSGQREQPQKDESDER